jgi:hypothetical protein
MPVRALAVGAGRARAEASVRNAATRPCYGQGGGQGRRAGSLLQPAEVRCPAPGQHRRVEPRRQRRDPARGQLAQPACLRLPVIGVVVPAAAAPVPGRAHGRGEPARLVHRPGIGGRDGERLDRHQPDPERRQVIAGQRPRPGMRNAGGGRPHAQPLVRAHPLQPRRPLPAARHPSPRASPGSSAVTAALMRRLPSGSGCSYMLFDALPQAGRPAPRARPHPQRTPATLSRPKPKAAQPIR